MGRSAPPLFDLTEAVRSVEGLDALVLFGSVARGVVSTDSDVDLLIVNAEPGRSARRRTLDAVAGFLPCGANVTTCTYGGLEQQLRRRPHFASHLADESELLYESSQGRFETAVTRMRPTVETLRNEIVLEIQALNILARKSQFAGLFAYPLSEIYASSRSIVTASLLLRDIHLYDWRLIYRDLAQALPSVEAEIRQLESLRPYYDYARRRMPPGMIDLESIDPGALDDSLFAVRRVGEAAIK